MEKSCGCGNSASADCSPADVRPTNDEPSLPQSPPQPEVSLLIVPAAGAEGLHQTLENALAQRTASTQVLLVIPADCSSSWQPRDGVVPTQLQVVHCPQAGRAAALNLGLEHCTGDAVAFLDERCVPDEDFASRLYAQLLIEDAELCHGEYAVSAACGADKDAPGPWDAACTDTAAIARSDGSPLACLGVLWSTLWKRSFIEEQQLRFDETFAGSCDLMFQMQALLSCRRWALCEEQVARAADLAQPELSEAERGHRLAACRTVAQLLCSAAGDIPERSLVRALAYLALEADVRLHSHEDAEALAEMCPTQLKAALMAEQAELRIAQLDLHAPLYRALEPRNVYT